MPLRSLTWPSSTIPILVTGALFAMAACSGNPLRVGPRDAGAKGGPGGVNVGGGTGGTAGVSGAGGVTVLSDGGVDLPVAVGGRDGGGPGDVAVRLDQAPDLSAGARAKQVCRDAIVAQYERLYACQGFFQSAVDLTWGSEKPAHAPLTVTATAGPEAIAPSHPSPTTGGLSATEPASSSARLS